MKVQVQKWGNSLAFRIPKPFAKEAAVREGTVLELSVSEGRLVAVPLRRKRPSLQSLLVKIEDSNLHGESDLGEAVGRESW